MHAEGGGREIKGKERQGRQRWWSGVTLVIVTRMLLVAVWWLTGGEGWEVARGEGGRGMGN